MEISFAGYQENVLTFECDGTVEAGDFVKMSASGKVAKATVNDAFIGACVSAKDGFAAVQLGGYVEAKKVGTVNVGYNKLVTTISGVKTGDNGRERLVIYSDDTIIGFIL